MGARLAAGFLLPEIRYLPATAGAGLPAPAGRHYRNSSATTVAASVNGRPVGDVGPVGVRSGVLKD